jgi:hypothetical protein
MNELQGLHKIEKIKPETFTRWLKIYPKEKIIAEMKKASDYLLTNNKKYKDYQRFYGNWLRRSIKTVDSYDAKTVKMFFDQPDDNEWPLLLQLVEQKGNED